jgi:hypothetical protein
MEVIHGIHKKANRHCLACLSAERQAGGRQARQRFLLPKQSL